MGEVDTDRVLADARRICAVPAPTFAEGPRGELVAAMLAEAGAAVTRDGVGNVVAELGPGGGEPVLFAAHLDTVFPAATEIAFVERDGRLAAPGIGDNSLGVAGIVDLARHLGHRVLHRPVVLVATVGEEGLGDLRGAKALLDERPCGAFVAVEGAMLASITVAAVGSLRFRIRARGPGGHSWGDRGTPSAVDALIERLQRIVKNARDAGAAANIGVIHGGTAVNVIAAEASAELDLRSEDDAVLTRAAEFVRAELRDGPRAVAFETEALGHRPGGRIDPQHELLRAARRAREHAGLPAAHEDASSTDANAAHGRGIPAITVGLTTGGNEHRLEEYIDLAPLAGGIAALRALADELAS